MPAQPKLRRDLVSSPSEVDGATVYTVKDPIGGNYFRLRGPEHWLIHQFDGDSTPEEIAARFRDKFQLNVTADNVRQFVALMDKLLFLENSRSEQTIGRASAGAYGRGSALGRLLYLKLKAFKPGRFLEALVSLYRPFHRPFWWLLQAAVILIGLGLLALHVEEFEVDLVELWNLQSIGLIVLSLFILVTLHEFAHAVLCRMYGGEVREIGFLLMYFQPCFYCDLSDAWLFEKKSQRVAVTLAGPYFQLILLALSVILWRLTVPGLFLSNLAWTLVTVNWVVFLFNFNPLIKLDAYYLLSDWLDIPNLRRKAFAWLSNRFQRHILGWPVENPEVSARHSRIFLIYGITALAYSGWLLGYVVWLVSGFLLAKIGPAGLLLFVLALVVILHKALRRLAGGVLKHIGHMKNLFKKPLRLAIYLALLAVVLVVVIAIPMPQRVSGDITVRPIAEFTVVLNEYGLLEETTRFGGEVPESKANILQLASTDMATLQVLPLVSDGQKVVIGDTIALVSSNQITREIETGRAELSRLQGELALLKASPKAEEVREAEAHIRTARLEMDQLERDRDRIRSLVNSNAEAAVLLETTQSQLDVAAAELATRQSALDLLKAPPRPEEVEVVRRQIEKQEAQLAYLMEQEAASRIVSPIFGTARLSHDNQTLVSIANQNPVELLVPVSDFDITLVSVGQEVQVKVRSFPSRTFKGTVVRIPEIGSEEESRIVFRVTVIVENADGLLRNGMSGYAKIVTGEASLLSIGFRKIYQNLKVEFWSWW
jgi:hypothetical protein